MQVTGWPFPVLIKGDPTAGTPAVIVVEWRFDPALTEEERDAQVDQVACVVTWWCLLINGGAGGGQRVLPDRTAATLIDVHQPERSPNRLKWTIRQLSIDPRAFTILLNLVLTSELAVVGVTVSCHGADGPDVVTPNDYPPLCPHVPFGLELERVDRNLALEAEFSGDVPDGLRGPIEELLQVWSLVGALGGFRENVALGEHSELQPLGAVVFEFDLVSLQLRDRGVSEAAYHAVVSVFVRLVATTLPVRTLAIR